MIKACLRIKTRYFTALLISSLLLLGCNTAPKKATLRDIDKVSDQIQQSPVFIKPKTEAEIRAAYANYIKYASKDDKGRKAALSRLAEIEFELSNKLLLETQNLESSSRDDTLDDKLYNERLNKTIELLTTSLRDYENAKNNDRILYQLAKAHDQKGEYQQSIKYLQQLAGRYPKSPYYVESMFRLAEEAFARRDYISAEDAYTEVIASPYNDIFFEKAIFKRGWARYKQQLYTEALDDYLDALLHHEFGDYHTLSKSDKTQFDEYFRAIGLSFAHLDSMQSLHAYFKDKPDFKYVFYSYSTVSDIFLKQERFSDAANILEQFQTHYPKSEELALSRLQLIKIWQTSGFTKKLHPIIEDFYQRFNPDSHYWQQNAINPEIYQTINNATKQYILLISQYYHNKYQQNHRTQDFEKADIWYQRYLKHYPSFVRKDNIFYLYAELLAEAKKDEQALYYYEKSAYDKDLILNKEAAYASIIISGILYNKQITKNIKNVTDKNPNNKLWLNKHINYAILFSQLYPNDKRRNKIILHAAELAFGSQQYDKAIELSELIADSANSNDTNTANYLRAQAYFRLAQYSESEAIYSQVLASEFFNRSANKQQKSELENNLAIAIYQQAESAKQNQDIASAYKHYARIASAAPQSSIAATGLYDAIALSMSKNLWQQAIKTIERFRILYPKHKLNADVSKKLSVAYLNSKQDIKAAQEFEKISSLDDDQEIKQTALWQAAALYESKQDYPSAIRSYKTYAHNFKQPYVQNVESMYKLTKLYTLNNAPEKAKFWKLRIIKADKTAAKKHKTDRTRFIVASISLSMAIDAHRQYRHFRLIEPLNLNLRRKKQAMQKAVKLYSQASSYGIAEITTEATYAIADIYNSFSRALLNSERPKKLNEEELEQYNILIEDQAFPFEEKAIEFFEINLARTKQGSEGQWIQKSHTQLQQLYPVRYKREPKVNPYSQILSKPVGEN